MSYTRLGLSCFFTGVAGCCLAFWWRGLDSNQRRRKPTDLQSAPFSHSGTSPQRTIDYGLPRRSCQALSVADAVLAWNREGVPAWRLALPDRSHKRSLDFCVLTL
ncbi:protein of unknown function [Cupriavidus taiwanensis]|uniref:Lipoprotein n=1 Tax=Cupriavidus taiwanensis TaxID=164546 RepID=A0A9Q7UWV4_9BURK|nr:protein of unknown function [Cupriavidus taiwanensis]